MDQQFEELLSIAQVSFQISSPWGKCQHSYDYLLKNVNNILEII